MADGAPGDGPALTVRRAGLLDLLVDAGRHGWQRFGMPPGGAADAECHRIACLLAGGPADAAAIEVTARGPELEAGGAACRVAVACAGEVDAVVLRAGGAEEPLAPLSSATLHPGDRLRVGRVAGVLRAYVAVRGGVAVAPQLGGRGACTRGGTTGILARGLRAGDVLPLDAAACEPEGPERRMPRPALLDDRSPLLLCAGPQRDRLPEAGLRALTAASAGFRAAAAVDRTGVRLEGPPIGLRGGADVASQGCPAGALQVSGDGAAILLGPDRGTTGGYAIPLVLAAHDLPRLGRVRPGAPVRFAVLDDLEIADEVRRLRAVALEQLARTLTAA